MARKHPHQGNNSRKRLVKTKIANQKVTIHQSSYPGNNRAKKLL